MNLSTRSSVVWTWVFLGAIVALAALLRGLCLSAELWLDEVWSWEFARMAHTPWDIFTAPALHHDNNHKLNTLYLFIIPDGWPFAFYRLHSFVAGVASVLLAFRAASRRGTLEGLFAALLVGVNYWFVLCAAEARGYALVLAFALAAFDGLQRYLREGGQWYLAQFQFAVIFGFLAHLTFLNVYLALAVWTVYHFARQRATKGNELKQLIRVHALPAGFLVLLYLLDVRGMQIGGAPSMPPEEQLAVLGRLLCLSLGLDLPFSFMKFAFAAVCVFVVYVRGFQVLRRDHDDSWVFFAMAIVGAPLMLVLARRPDFIYERYFFLSVLFFLLQLAYVLADMVRRTPLGKIAAGVVLLLIAVGNFGEVQGFVENGGRGDFQKALEYIAEHSSSKTTITSDSDLRVPKMLDFYRLYGPSRLHYKYVALEEWRLEARRCGWLAGPTGRFGYSTQHAAEWLIIERPEHGHRPALTIFFPENGDAQYELEAAYEVGAFGGWDWYIYRHAAITP